jgi:hypothetical protein
MQKEELIYIHSVLAQVKRQIEAERADADFSGYEVLHIQPVHLYRSKNDHKRAIFTLGEEIARAIGPGPAPGPVRHQRKSVSRSKGMTTI